LDLPNKPEIIHTGGSDDDSLENEIDKEEHDEYD
jgi:hypothetical protein